MRLGIDASNLRRGGGVTHLTELLRVAQPEKWGIKKISVWSGKSMLEQLTPKPWLERCYEPILDRSLPYRIFWQKEKFPKIVESECDFLFVPGGSSYVKTLPYVAMSQNMLLFEPKERKRYGFSFMNMKLMLLRLAQSRTFINAEGNIFLTEYAKNTIQAQLPSIPSDYSVVSHGIGQSYYMRPRTSKSIDEYSLNRPFRLLYVSIVDVYKHQWNVIEAVGVLRAQGIPVVLDLIGPAYKPALKKMNHSLSKIDPTGDFINYLGAVPYKDLPSYYHKSDGFVYASSCENMPIILMEAMAAGLPIACSSYGPMPEILQDAGIYFNPEKPNEIAQALHRLIIYKSDRQAWADSAYMQAKTYSWEKCSNETLACIQYLYS